MIMKDGRMVEEKWNMCACEYIVRLVTSVKNAKNFKFCCQQSLIDLERLNSRLSQEAFKGEPDLPRVQQDVRQPEGGQGK